MLRKTLLQLLILLVLLDHNCRDLMSWLYIICQFPSLLLTIVKNGNFIRRKVTQLHHSFPMQFGMCLTIIILYSCNSKGCIKMMLKVDPWSAAIYCAALYWASPYLFKGYFRPFQTYLIWAFTSVLLHKITGQWAHSLTAALLSSVKLKCKKNSASDLCDTLCSRLHCVKSAMISCFPAVVTHLPFVPLCFSLQALRVVFIHHQATPDEDISLGEEDNGFQANASRRPIEESSPEDEDLSLEEQTPSLLDEGMALLDLPQGTQEDIVHVDSGIADASVQDSNMDNAFAISSSHQYSTNQREYSDVENTFNCTDQDFPAVAQGSRANTHVGYADSGVSSSYLSNNSRSGMNHDDGAYSALSITLVKEMFLPPEPAVESEGSTNNPDPIVTDSHSDNSPEKNESGDEQS